MKIGTYSANSYIDRLYEESENTDKGYNMSNVPGLVIPEENKKHFDWLNKEYQKGKTEVKIEIKGEGSSFKPGYDLQTDRKRVKDFQPGMYGDVKTEGNGLSKGKKATSPKNKKEDNDAEETDPKDAKESTDKKEPKTDKNPKAQQLKVDMTKNKKDDK